MTTSERLLLAMTIGVGAMAYLLATLLGRIVEWPPFLSSYVAAIGFVLVGSYIRNVKRKPRIALGLQGIGFYMAFASPSAVLIYSLLPLPYPMIDPFLTETGHWVGYDWREFVAFMIGYPKITYALNLVYQSIIPQMLILVCVLALYRRPVELFRYLFVGMISFLITVALWWRWPSVGYVGVLPYTKEEMLAGGLQFSANKGEVLTRLLQEGVEIISPPVITGIVGFPSYHIVMALMVTCYSRRTLLFLPILAVNLAMIPATLLHGGHHMFDLVGGLLVFILSVLVARHLIRPDNSPDEA